MAAQETARGLWGGVSSHVKAFPQTTLQPRGGPGLPAAAVGHKVLVFFHLSGDGVFCFLLF